jgi:hypothetical protein
VVPYVGSVLGDVTLSDEGNADVLEGNLINMAKFDLISNAIKKYLRWQKTLVIDHKVAPKEVLLMLLGEPSYLEAEDLYEMSLIVEPRGASMQEIL